MSESQGDRASLGVQDDAVGRDGRHRDSPLDDVPDPEELLPRTDAVLQDCEAGWLGQDDPAQLPCLSDELVARRLRPAPWLRTAVSRREHDGDCENERRGQKKRREAPMARQEPAGICVRYFALTRKRARFLAQHHKEECGQQERHVFHH